MIRRKAFRTLEASSASRLRISSEECSAAVRAISWDCFAVVSSGSSISFTWIEVCCVDCVCASISVLRR